MFCFSIQTICCYSWSVSLVIQLTSSSGDGAACPSDPVVFTCTVETVALLWTIDPPLNHTSGPDRTDITNSISLVIIGNNGVGNREPAGPEGFIFQAAITATDNLTSTLTTLTEVSLLNGITVSCTCTTGQSESLTIIVAGELTGCVYTAFDGIATWYPS